MIELPYIPKPLRGSACNQCGLCCALTLCDAASVIFGGVKNMAELEVLMAMKKELPGPCPALEYENGRAWCGIIRNPEKYIKPKAGVVPDFDGIKSGMIRALGIGQGCSMKDP